MEYVEREVGHLMQWWDPLHNVRCSLVDITEHVDSFGGKRPIKFLAGKNTLSTRGTHYPSYFYPGRTY